MPIVKLHNIGGEIEEVDTRSLIECKELPEYTQITTLKRVRGSTPFGSTQRVVIKVAEKKAAIRQMILDNKEIIGVIPLCLLRERKSFEEIRAERRKREVEAANK